MKIAITGPDREQVLTAFGSVSGVKFGTPGYGEVELGVKQACWVGDLTLPIDIPRSYDRVPNSAVVVTGQIKGGNFDEIEAAALVTFDDDGGFLCAVFVRKADDATDADLDAAPLLLGLIAKAVGVWIRAIAS